jgi:mannosyltransferase OCH1-like enzyme
LPELALKCIESWKKYCPDYEIIEWNEKNFDVNMNPYTQKCYNEKKYAFLSDYVRLWAIKHHGGIYLDTDVETIKSFDPLLSNSSFFGFENHQYVNTGQGFGAEKYNPLVTEMLRQYDTLLTGESDYVGCPILNTTALLNFGLIQNGQKQNLDFGFVFPADYFNPYDDSTGKINKTNNTFSIHWYSKSWLPNKTKLISSITRIFHRIFGVNCFKPFKKFIRR